MIPDKIVKRLILVQEYYQLLEKKLLIPKEEFLKNPDNYLSAERLLQLISEAMIDISNHIIAKKQLGKPETYSDIFMILSKKGIISEELGEKLLIFAGLRNILVHDYLGLDRERLYLEAKDNKDDIIIFITQIRQFLRKNSGNKL